MILYCVIFFAVTIVNGLSVINSNGKEFCAGIMKLPDSSFLPYILVGTASSIPVNFSIEYTKEIIGKTDVTTHASYHQTVADEPYIIPLDLLPNIDVQSDSYTDRNKGLCFSTKKTNETIYMIPYYLYTRGIALATASYLALPYQEMLTDTGYQYYVLSTGSSSIEYNSGFLLVGFEPNTSITIYPSLPLNITNDTQDINSVDIAIGPGESHTVILNRRQTLYIGKNGGADVTGTRIVSDKPLTVISGHEAGSVPNDGTQEPMAQQIPPTQLWGDRFMIVPLGGHQMGQIIKVLSSVDSTAVIYNCHQFNNSIVLDEAGSVHQFFVPYNVYCYIEANNSVLVVQFPYSPDGNTDGDTTMILVASTDQYYSNEIIFWTLNSSNDDMHHHISITVPVEHYNINTILYDGEAIDSNCWRPIYGLYNETVGYGCSLSVTAGHHTVSITNGRLFVMVYGFGSTGKSDVGRAYGYPAGIQFPPNRVLGLYFSSDDYKVQETDGSVNIVLYRETHINYTNNYHFSTTSSSSDTTKYVPVNEDVVFNSTQSSLTVPVVINDNIITEGNVSFTVQLCRVSDPLEGVCIESTVTIVDDDVLVIGITEFQYDMKNNHVTITVEILLGELCAECTVHATLTTTLVLTGDTNDSSTSSPITLSPGHTIDTMTNSVHGILKLYPDKSLIAIISELTLVNNNVPVNATPSECQLNVLGGDSEVNCNNPSSSSASMTSSTPTTQTSMTSQTSQTIMTSQTSMTSPPTTVVPPPPSPSWSHTTSVVVPSSPLPIVDDTNNKTTLYIILGTVIPVALIIMAVACIAVSVVLWRKRRAGNFPSRPSSRASRGSDKTGSSDSDPDPNVDDDINDDDGKELVMMSNPKARDAEVTNL